jgi:ribosomal protein L34E
MSDANQKLARISRSRPNDTDNINEALKDIGRSLGGALARHRIPQLFDRLLMYKVSPTVRQTIMINNITNQ